MAGALFFLVMTNGLALSTGEKADAIGRGTIPAGSQPRSGGLVLKQSTVVPGSEAITTSNPQPFAPLQTQPPPPSRATAAEVHIPVSEPAFATASSDDSLTVSTIELNAMLAIFLLLIALLLSYGAGG